MNDRKGKITFFNIVSEQGPDVKEREREVGQKGSARLHCALA